MIEHIARFPRLRDRAVFVGNPGRHRPRVVRRRAAADPRLDGAALRLRRLRHRLRPGATRGRPRPQLGYGDDEQCLHRDRRRLRRRSPPAAPRRSTRTRRRRSACPDLRMIVVAGPRIDPESLPQHDGLEVRAYVHDLYRHLAACDLAVVQGGLTTCDGADREPATVPLLPAPPPLRAELPRAPPARALRGRALHGLRDRRPGRDRWSRWRAAATFPTYAIRCG